MPKLDILIMVQFFPPLGIMKLKVSDLEPEEERILVRMIYGDWKATPLTGLKTINLNMVLRENG